MNRPKSPQLPGRSHAHRPESPQQQRQVAPPATQAKGGTPQPKVNHPTAPPVYRPQATPRVLQQKTGPVKSRPVVQCLFPGGYGVYLTSRQVSWNALLGVQAAYPNLAYPAAMAGRITAYENNYMALTFEQELTGLRQLRDDILAGLETLRQNLAGTNNLDWNNMLNFLNNLAALGLVNVASVYMAPLPAHNYNGDLWTATVASSGQALGTGTVPVQNAAHGRTPQARNGARGAIRAVVVGHNTELDAIKTRTRALVTDLWT
jgi:hypothetical protein